MNNDPGNLSHWMAQAMEAAHAALPEDVPVGALLIKDGKIIARQCNRRERDQNPIAHAELLALAEAGAALGNWRLNGTMLVVTLEPCPMCASAILQSRVSTLVFGAYDPLMGACGSRYNLFSEAKDLEVIGGIREDENQERLKSFFSRQRG
jgi:tRNA(adenine34) deaminase